VLFVVGSSVPYLPSGGTEPGAGTQGGSGGAAALWEDKARVESHWGG